MKPVDVVLEPYRTDTRLLAYDLGTVPVLVGADWIGSHLIWGWFGVSFYVLPVVLVFSWLQSRNIAAREELDELEEATA